MSARLSEVRSVGRLVSLASRAGGAALVLCAAIACGSDAPPAYLTDLVEVGPTDCPAGGRRVVVGPDRDADGVLDADEIAKSTVLCNGVAGEPGTPGLGALVVTSTEAPGARCAEGGVRIDVGIDDDRDGALDAEEIDRTAYVCDGVAGAPGLAALVATATVGPGADCAAGGLRVDVGVDDDRDGRLSAAEVDGTRFVCDGRDGRGSRTTIVAEPPGAACARGGQRVEVGVDLDDDGVLDPSEVTTSAVVCDPVPSLVRTSSEAAGARCAFGGARFELGLDVDGDGALDAGEVTQTSYACSGTPGATSLVAVTPEAPGPRCANGGARVATGLDVDGDGALEPSEEGAFTFVCDGVDGQNGTNGTNGTNGSNGTNGTNGADGSMVRVAAEPAGASCANGGQRFQTGPDTNRNGVLDDAEVTATSFVCNGAARSAAARLRPLAPGAECANGGQRLEAGVDDDADGVLDDDEVRTSAVVCNGLAAVPFAILTTSLPDGLVGAPYSASLTAAGGTGGSYRWRVVAGTLPAGLSLGATGTPGTTITGVVTTAGTFDVTIQVEDFFGQAVQRAYRFEISDGLRVTTFALPRSSAGVAYTTTLRASGAIGPLTWTVVEGLLPAGLTLAPSTGVISGTPLGRAGSTFIVRASDGTNTVDASLTIRAAQRWVAFLGDVAVDTFAELFVADISGVSPQPAQRISPVLGTGGNVVTYEFSPDGSRIAFRADADADNVFDLYVVDLLGATPSGAAKVNPTLPAASDVLDFTWSRDGRYLAYRADQRADEVFELFVSDVSGAAPTTPVLVNGPLVAGGDIVSSAYEFTPDNARIVYLADQDVDLMNELYIADVGTSTPTPRKVSQTLVSPTLSDVTTPIVFSPNGRWVLYRADADVADQDELYMVDISRPAPGPARKVNGALIAAGDVLSTSFGFSPDGAFVSYLADQSFDSGVQVFVVPTSSAGPGLARLVSPAITDGTLSVSDALWSPSGRRIAFRGDLTANDVFELYVVDVYAPAPQALRLNGPMVLNADLLTGYQWLPNGDGVVYRSDEALDTQDQLYLARLTSAGAPTLLNMTLGVSSDVDNFALSEDGRRVLFMADPVTAADDNLFAVELVGAGAPTAPVQVNGTLPSLADVFSGYRVRADGVIVIYRADEAVNDDNELWAVNISETGVPRPSVRVNGTLVSAGDVTSLALEP